MLEVVSGLGRSWVPAVDCVVAVEAGEGLIAGFFEEKASFSLDGVLSSVSHSRPIHDWGADNFGASSVICALRISTLSNSEKLASQDMSSTEKPRVGMAELPLVGLVVAVPLRKMRPPGCDAGGDFLGVLGGIGSGGRA